MSVVIDNAILEGERVARAIIPELQARELYIVQPARGSMVPPGMLDAYGMYERGLDLALQPQLEREGRWRGRGICIIIDAFLCFCLTTDDCRGHRRVVGAILHELAHWLEMCEATKVAADHYEKIVAGCEAHKAQKQEPTPSEDNLYSPVALWHGEEFTRLCCHLWYRARHAGRCILRPEYMAFGSDYPCLEYLHQPVAYIEALGDELELFEDMPLRRVAAFPQPEAYTDLWNETFLNSSNKAMTLSEAGAA